MGRNLVETIMGAVVLLVAGIFLVFALSFSQVETEDGYTVFAKFNAIDGLTKGSDVRISGVKVGAVVDETIDMEEYRAKVTLNLKSGVRVPVDSKVSVTSSGLLGGKYVKIEPGSASEYVADGGELTNTKDVILIEELLGKVIFLVSGED